MLKQSQNKKGLMERAFEFFGGLPDEQRNTFINAKQFSAITNLRGGRPWYDQVFGELDDEACLLEMFKQYSVALKNYEEKFDSCPEQHRQFLCASFFVFKYLQLCLSNSYAVRYVMSKKLASLHTFCEETFDLIRTSDRKLTDSAMNSRDEVSKCFSDIYEVIKPFLDLEPKEGQKISKSRFITVGLKDINTEPLTKLTNYASSQIRALQVDKPSSKSEAVLMERHELDEGEEYSETNFSLTTSNEIVREDPQSSGVNRDDYQESRLRWFFTCLCACSRIKKKNSCGKFEGYNLSMLLQVQYQSHAKTVLPSVLFLTLILMCYSSSILVDADPTVSLFSSFFGVVFLGLSGNKYAYPAGQAHIVKCENSLPKHDEDLAAASGDTHESSSAENEGRKSDSARVVGDVAQLLQPEFGVSPSNKLTKRILKEIYKEYSWSFFGYRSYYKERFPDSADVDQCLQNIVEQANRVIAKGKTSASVQALDALSERGYVEHSDSAYTLTRSQNLGC